MEDFSNKSVCIRDNGLFVSLAIALSKRFGKVYYTTPWRESAFPKSNARMIGQGIPGVEWIEDIYDVKADLYCFPDCYSSSLQMHLVDVGKRVWGSRCGDELEIYREDAKKLFKKLGLPVGKYEVVYGLDKLREYLKAHDNVWVKNEETRGDMESFHSKNYKLIEPRLDELEHNLGALKLIHKFVVEDSIDNAVETGIDTYTVDGQFPNKSMVGIEIKDKGYVGIVREYKSLPLQITQFCDTLAPIFEKYQYRNFFSTENRVVRNGTSYMNDFCARQGSPPSELYLYMLKNLAEIIWYGAEGELVEPEYSNKYGAEVLIQSAWADKNWQAVEFPKEVKDNVILRNMSIIKGKYYAMPQAVCIPEIGGVVADGSTIEEAIKKVKAICDKVEGYYLEMFCESLDRAQDEISKLSEFGINLIGK